MARRPTYPPEFRRRVLELARAGRSINSLARGVQRRSPDDQELAQARRLDSGQRTDGLTSDERKELSQLRRENKRLKLEAEILSKAAAWFARETNVVPNKSSDS